MSDKVSNRIALVTGGSTGIGLAIAQALLNEGAARVYITGRSATKLDQAARLLGERAAPIVSDVANLADLRKLKESIEKRGDLLDAVYANAGIAETNRLGETTEEAYDRLFDINVKGVFFTVQTLLPLIKDGAAIILTSSFVANKGMENLSLYNASKAAVRSFARSLANDLKQRKIRVTALSPGFTRTPIQENSLKMNQTQIADLTDFANKNVPLGYMAQPEDIAKAALFLASQDAGYINGINLVVDGGFTQI